MEIGKKETEFLKDLINLCSIIGIEDVLIDSDSARGLLKEDGIIIIEKDRTIGLDWPFTSMAIPLVSVFKTRLNLIGEKGKIIVDELKEKDNGDKNAFKLKIKNDKSSVEFRCSDPAKLGQMPKNLKDKVQFSFIVDTDTANILSKTSSAMSSKMVSIIFDGNKVEAKINDDSGNMFNHLITKDVTIHDPNEKQTFHNTYKIKLLNTLFKGAEKDFKVEITNRGILGMTSHGIHVYVIAEI